MCELRVHYMRRKHAQMRLDMNGPPHSIVWQNMSLIHPSQNAQSMMLQAGLPLRRAGLGCGPTRASYHAQSPRLAWLRRATGREQTGDTHGEEPVRVLYWWFHLGLADEMCMWVCAGGCGS